MADGFQFDAFASDAFQMRLGGGTAAAILGGDDVVQDRGHRGWSRKRSLLKRNRDAEFTEQIRSIYRALTADPETAPQAEQALAAAVPEPQPADRRVELLRERADALRASAVDAEIALRFLYRKLIDLEHERDESDVMEILGYLI